MSGIVSLDPNEDCWVRPHGQMCIRTNTFNTATGAREISKWTIMDRGKILELCSAVFPTAFNTDTLMPMKLYLLRWL